MNCLLQDELEQVGSWYIAKEGAHADLICEITQVVNASSSGEINADVEFVWSKRSEDGNEEAVEDGLESATSQCQFQRKYFPELQKLRLQAFHA